VWGFTTGITDVAGDGKTYIGQYRVLKDWATYLPKALAFFTHFGAQAPFRIEVGVEGLKNVYWAGEITERVRSLESSVIYVRQAREWGRNSQLAYLTEAYNELCDAFNRPRLSPDQVERILPRIPE